MTNKRITKTERETLKTWLQNTHSQRERVILARLGYNNTDDMINALVFYSNNKQLKEVYSW